jgi:3-deoxy-manno-octulosonate cytidylyltransferase (CMP-KDO synthetase)
MPRKPDTSSLMKVVAIIPARLASTRLPGKMLLELRGRPIPVWVYQGVRRSNLVDDVVIATDSDKVMQLCAKHACKAVMTSAKHRSGTERVHEVAEAIGADLYINVQGDEPMVRAEHVDALVSLMDDPEKPVGTLKTPCAPPDVANPNAVKVVSDISGRALYFSRSTIPFDRDGSQPRYFKHLGIYAYRKWALDRFVALSESSLERAERLEQLRFMECGIPIYVAETPFDSIGVDTEEDFLRVQKLLK